MDKHHAMLQEGERKRPKYISSKHNGPKQNGPKPIGPKPIGPK